MMTQLNQQTTIRYRVETYQNLLCFFSKTLNFLISSEKEKWTVAI